MRLLFFRPLLCLLFIQCSLMAEIDQENSETDQLLEKAQQFYEAALYLEAIPIYQKLLHEIPYVHEDSHVDSLKAHRIRLRLAQSHYFLNQFKEVIDTLRGDNKEEYIFNLEDEELYRKGLYLSALAHRNLDLHEKAVEELQLYLKSGNNQQLPLCDEVNFELGLNNFLLNQLESSETFFKSISPNTQKTQIYFLSRFYLIRINLLRGLSREAEQALRELSLQIPKGDSLLYELAYLQGEVQFQVSDYLKAAEHFEEALPKNNRDKCPWHGEALYLLGWCYLKIGESAAEQARYLQKALETFQTLLSFSSDEKVYLALGQCYLTRARCLKEDEAYILAENLLSKQEIFVSREAQAHALLLRAEAAPSYAIRDKFYRQLTQETNSESSFYAKGWYLRGLNDFEEGKSLRNSKANEAANKAFERAAFAFKRAFECFIKMDEKVLSGLALKYRVMAYEEQNTHDSCLEALAVLDHFLIQYPDILQTMEHPDEIFYLKGVVASHLAKEDDKEKFTRIAETAIEEGTARFPKGKFADISLNLLGALQFRMGEYKQAEKTYLRLANDYSNSQYAGEAWFWAANCSDQLESKSTESKLRREKVFENYSESPFAAEAFFTYYSYREYLQGDRAAIKHLQGFSSKYPDSPLLIQAQYLVGIDYKRDRKTEEGKWIRKRNLTAAIDAFQEVETIYDNLKERKLIPSELSQYYLLIRYRATLERALANLAIADESLGAKRQIYLEYAEEVFKQLADLFENPQFTLSNQLMPIDTFAQIQEESYFWLAQTYIKGQNDETAEKTFSKMLDRYRSVKTTRGYFLSRVWYEQGMIALRRQEYALALQCFKHAEDAAKGRVLNIDQKLDLLIQQSHCLRGLNQFDNALLILSKVINDNAISSLRLKAMFLRAEIYELQERPELARKQLQTTAKKGGEWALKAKEKLEKNYGF